MYRQILLSAVHRMMSIWAEERVVQKSKTNMCCDRLMIKSRGRKIHISSVISLGTMISLDLEKIS